MQKQATQNGQTENVYIISINCRDKKGTNGTNAGYQNGTNVALLLSKNGGQPKCFAGIHLSQIKEDIESNKRRFCNIKIDSVKLMKIQKINQHKLGRASGYRRQEHTGSFH